MPLSVGNQLEAACPKAHSPDRVAILNAWRGSGEVRFAVGSPRNPRRFEVEPLSAQGTGSSSKAAGIVVLCIMFSFLRGTYGLMCAASFSFSLDISKMSLSATRSCGIRTVHGRV